MGINMDLVNLNPFIRSASLYEKVGRSEECVAYDCRVIYMISGDLQVTVGGEKLGHLSPGHFLYIPAGLPYKLKSKYLRAVVVTFDLMAGAPSSERICPVLTADFDMSRCSPLIKPFDKHIHLQDMESEREAFIRMADLFTSAEGFYRECVSASLKELLLKAAETADENALPARMVEQLDRYIRDNCRDEISNTELGAIFGYHPFYISKVLKDKRGITLRQYVINYRLKLAKKMLELTDKTAAEIADETGFTDASYFAKTFKSTFGMTPKEYRNQFKEDFV